MTAYLVLSYTNYFQALKNRERASLHKRAIFYNKKKFNSN